MMASILESYSTLFLSIGVSSLAILMIGLYFIFKTLSPKLQTVGGDMDSMSAIAGEDVMTTQLDLARAFIETDRKQSAKSILELVSKRGSADQKQEAKRLLKAL